MSNPENLQWSENQKNNADLNRLVSDPENLDSVALWDLDDLIKLAELQMAGNDDKIAKLQAIIESNSNFA